MPVTPQKRKAPFGAWPSPMAAADVVARSTELRHGLGQMALDGDDVYWIEGRPHEGGRNIVGRRDAHGRLHDASPPGISVRTLAHEYGGGDFTAASGVLYYVAEADQRICAWNARSGALPTPWSPLPESGTDRFADLVVDPPRNRLLCIREHHPRSGEASNALVAVTRGAVTTIASGADFYASPALSPDGSRLAWLQWNHPNMPWDGCELWLAELDERGTPTAARCIAGGMQESIFQPTWSPDALLYFVSDRSGWANLYRWDGDSAHAVCPMAAEFAAPQWVFGESTFGFASATVAVCAFTSGGFWRLATIDLASGELNGIPVPHSDIAHLRVAGRKVYYRGGAPTLATSLIELDLDSGAFATFRGPEPHRLGVGIFSAPEPIEFPSSGDSTARGFLYPPHNESYTGEPGTRPPLIVISHGGPTAAASTALDLKIQFWTTRGFAVLDVNYRGSTGFGRAYREALNGAWGCADVDDCVAGALYLVARGSADPDRLAIRGSSAGGYTCLCALTFHDVFHAGACYYGVSDLEALARDTHKFESHYTDTLVGPYPERRDLYRERSPIHFIDRLACPLIIFQGLQDEIVPPSQSESVVTALRAKGIAVEYLTFADEGHGFRHASNGRRALEAELAFYARLFGFTPAGEPSAAAVAAP